MSKIVNFIIVLLLACLCLSSTPANAEPANLLNDPSADEYTDDWRTRGDVEIEEIDGDLCFVIRNGGTFFQDIPLHEDAVGKFVLLTALVSRERVNAYGTITDLPYLYGYMMDEVKAEDFSGISLYSYLHVPSYVEISSGFYSGRAENEWFVLGGIFLVPENTKMIRLFLNQARQEGVPHNGSAARFDDVGVYLFTSINEANLFFDEFHY